MMQKHTSASARQSGIALPVALIMTLLIALLGMTMIRGGIVSELVTSNQQQKFIATEAAQSSVNAISNYLYLKNQISDPNYVFDNPPPIPQPGSETGITERYDFVTAKGSNINIDGEVTVQYCGVGEPIGGSLDANESAAGFVSIEVDISSVAKIENTNAKALVVQRLAFPGPASPRSGACVIH